MINDGYYNDEHLQNQAANLFLKAEDWLLDRTEPEAEYLRTLCVKFKHNYDDKKSLGLIFGTTPGQLKIYQRNLYFLEACKLLRRSEDRSYYCACGELVTQLDKFRNPAYALCKTGKRTIKNELERVMFNILEVDNKTMRQDSIFFIVKNLPTGLNQPFFPS